MPYSGSRRCREAERSLEDLVLRFLAYGQTPEITDPFLQISVPGCVDDILGGPNGDMPPFSQHPALPDKELRWQSRQALCAKRKPPRSNMSAKNPAD